MASGIHQIIDRQIKRWELEALDRRQSGGDKLDRPGPLRPWVTISRSFGSGGGEIARRLASQLGYQIFDREIVDVICQEGHFRAAILESLDERERSSFDLWIDGLLHGNLVDKADYLRTLIEVLGAIAMHGHAIIIGRGANFVLDPGRGLHVRIVAPLPLRVETMSRLRNLSYADSEKLVHQTDHERAGFILHHFHRDVEDSLAYDMIVNTASIGVESAVALIERALREKMSGKPTVQL
jgi:cytidylate kinase